MVAVVGNEVFSTDCCFATTNHTDYVDLFGDISQLWCRMFCCCYSSAQVCTYTTANVIVPYYAARTNRHAIGIKTTEPLVCSITSSFINSESLIVILCNKIKTANYFSRPN